VNTQTVSLAGVEVLSINYGADEVILRESDGGDLIIREYMKKDRPRYYAQTSRSGSETRIRRQRLPWFTWSRKTRGEIYLPRSFRGELKLAHSSGNLSADTDLLNYKTIDINISSGSLRMNRLSGDTVSVRVSSGNLDLAGLGGGSVVSVSSGNLRIGNLAGPLHRIRVSSGRARIGTLQGNADIVLGSGTISFEKVLGRMEADISSGTLSLETLSGEGSFEVSSGNLTLDVAELTGDLRFRLLSGNAEMSLPEELSFNLDAVATSGNVRVDKGSEPLWISGNGTILRPFGPSPERTVFARITSGRLVIHWR
jgi:hypothetical protein